ncbi:MAG: sodium:proton antiporter, partial [bacterium]
MRKWFVGLSIILSLQLLLLSKDIDLSNLPLYTILPFILILLSIAILPLVNVNWWQQNYPMIAAFISLPIIIFLTFLKPYWLYYTALEYASFIALIGSLYIISGGIVIQEKLKISPYINTLILIIGAILANLIGTTGASLLLIRPLIKINKKRKSKVHIIIFFIFIVSNIAGCLLPLGDPPLFLGLIKGLPFFWTFKLFPVWLFTNTILITLFFIIDSISLKREGFVNNQKFHNKIKILGKRNFIFLLGIILITFIYSILPSSVDQPLQDSLQVLLMGTMVFLSLKITPSQYRKENNFTWAPIKEVTILFGAIFVTIIPLLKILEIRGSELGIQTAHQFFWSTGVLSSFLDNAPTYLSFLSLGKNITANLLSVTPNISVIKLSDGLPISEH